MVSDFRHSKHTRICNLSTVIFLCSERLGVFVAAGLVALLLIVLLIATFVITIMCYMWKNYLARRKNYKPNTVNIGNLSENRIVICVIFLFITMSPSLFCVQGLVSQTRWAVVYSLLIYAIYHSFSHPTQWENRRTGGRGQGTCRSVVDGQWVVLLHVNTCTYIHVHLTVLQVVIVIWREETSVPNCIPQCHGKLFLSSS